MDEQTRTQINVVLVDGADIQDAVTQATAIGMRVEQALGAVGILVGDIEQTRLDQLRQLPQVETVEASRRIEIAPPDSSTQ